MSEQLMVLTDRSRIETDARCPRLRYHTHEFCGTGLDLDKNATALAIGSCSHEGIAEMLNNRDEPRCLEGGIAAAQRAPEWDLLTEPDDQDLVEALVRTWWFAILPQLAGWEVLEVEREEVFDWIDQSSVDWAALSKESMDYDSQHRPTRVKMMSRLDLLARAKDGATLNGLAVAPGLYQYDWKTVKRADEKWKKGFLYDAQPLTQLLGVEQRLGYKLDGFIAEGLVKENHPLVYCWRSTKDGTLASRFRYTCEGMHPFRWAKGGMCLGGVTHTLSKTEYERVAVRDLEGGQAAWFERLVAEDPALLRECAVIAGPFSRRSDYEVEEWCEMNLPREVEIASVRSSEPLEEATLRRVFPKKTADYNCIKYMKGDGTGEHVCPALSMCWGADSADNYEPRIANHAIERIALSPSSPVGLDEPLKAV